MQRSSILIFATWAAFAAAPALAQPAALSPAVRDVVDAISQDRIAAHMRKLESFGTRDTHSAGNVAARQWILEEFKSYSPRLQVRFDAHAMKKKGRIMRDLDVVNVVAVLPGKSAPKREIVISGHYDSLNLVFKKGVPADQPDSMDNEASAAQEHAPGVSDDASGVAAVLELARVMSQHEFEKTIVFIAFGAEEQGLIGATQYSAHAKDTKEEIEAVLNNDIIGNDRSGSGVSATHVVRVFSGEPADSASRAVARYVREAAVRYVPSMKVDVVFRADRFARGGDHTPFHERGFGAVRFTTAAEALELQHTVNDTMEAASPAYTARVARVNAAAAASLALAPTAPVVDRRLPPLEPGRPERILPNLARGKGRYDAILRWTHPDAPADLKGYAVVMRSTTSPFWEREIFAGKVQEYTFKDFSIDDVILGVKAIGADGMESLVATYVMPPYRGQPQEKAPGPASN